MRRRESRAARVLLGLGVLAALAGIAGWIAFHQAFLRDLPDLRNLHDYRPLLTSRVLDRDGRPIGEFYDERRTLVSLEQVPQHVVNAFLAAEDDTFFEHGGLDYRAILRAFWVNLQAGGQVVQGGSTITQQVAKSLLLTPERRYTRKIKDMLLARRIEQHFSKQEILYLYLNQIYFGHGAYGLAEAARTYFGTTPGELSVTQAALLAGLPKAPSSYSPHNDPDAAEKRRSYVLKRMFEEGFITEGAYEDALAKPPEITGPPEQPDVEAAAWFTEEVRRQLFETLGGERVRREGLVIETTLDLDAQRAAVAAVRRGLEELDRRQGWRGPLRRVEVSAIEAALPELAAENGLAADDAAELPAGRALVGVVTRVDDAAGRAQVAFAPRLRGVVTLEDVRWARTPDPAAYPVPVRSIAKVLRAGDVARFMRSDAEGDGAAPRVRLLQDPAVEGALLALDVDRGEVVALVGGYDFARSEFNRATQARRQPGSAFKPIIYGAALRAGWTGASTIVDRPLVYTDPWTGEVWRPSNYKGRFYGRITLRDAIARSVNNATIHLLDEVGVKPTIEYARALGIEAPLEPNLSLALGASGLSLLELVRAYAVFPAQGRVVTPRFIRRVVDAQGNVLLENAPLGNAPAPEEAAAPPAAGDGKTAKAPEALPESEEPAASPRMARSETPLPPGHALSPVDAYITTDLLRGVITDPEGTGRKAADLGRPLAGKTGTTNEQRDAWFIGFSPDLVAGVWIGFDERKVLGKGETGGAAALPIWIDFMRAELARRPRREFEVPEGVVFARIDRATGLLAGSNQSDAVLEAFAEGTLPTETAEGAVAASEQDRMLRLDAF
jgi:penicillin-binding protein 1A